MDKSFIVGCGESFKNILYLPSQNEIWNYKRRIKENAPGI